ncbi:MAG TPA: hypothetical protein VGT40_15740 [Methylomirabilota bacterium]|jgi:hypothetical protein|nr:hypothetical protein [Methylomirabilota bacterium]
MSPHNQLADRERALEEVLEANRGENYCADCLAQAAGFTLEEQAIALVGLMRGAYRRVKDRVVEKGLCKVCGRADVIVRRVGERRVESTSA